MKILFSPSEGKSSINCFDKIDKNSFVFKELFNKRLQVVDIYQNYLKQSSIEDLKKLFGVKNIDNLDIDIINSPTNKAISRYDGVAYNYLNYNDLDKNAQKYIDENVIIFSNLFGPILAKDKIPFYKLKQGEKIGDFEPWKFYNQHFSKSLDDMLKDEDILDLRANFYEKFYKIKKPYYTLKFIKNNKVVSHWAKAYRGIVLKEIAQNCIEKIEQFLDISIKNLTLKEIIEQKNKKELIFEISS